MANKPLPCPTLLRQLLRYEPETGKLFWRARGARWFPDGYHSRTSYAKSWNAQYADKEAFTAKTNGYPYGAMFCTNFFAHRLIWKLVTGDDPEQVDHINGDRADNRWPNLRNVSNLENARNRKILDRNTSGHTGVYREKRTQRWVAYINGNGKKKHLGTFDAFDEAVAARRKAEKDMGFHKNHGRAV